jgi:nitrogen fixation protein NifU and related proteins
VTDDLRDLYQEVILDHYKNPRNYGALPAADRTAEGNNPLCGDHLTLFLKIDGDRVSDVRFEGSGCAISKASASLMTLAVKGKTETEVEDVFQRFHKMVTGDASHASGLGKLAALAGVSEFPVRVKCASLAWHTLKAALKGAKVPVSTEDPAS